MRSSTLVLWCSALLNVSWGQIITLLLLAPPELMDQAKVMAKQGSDGGPIEMTRATDAPGSASFCAAEVHTLDCDGKDSYHGFAHLHFEHPTNLPRPLTLTMPAYALQVSLGSTHQSLLNQ